MTTTGRKTRVANYPPVLTRATLDDAHQGILDFVEAYLRKKRFSPSMREVSRGLGHTAEWTRQACARLVTAGLLVVPKGIARGMRLADRDEYEAGVNDRWLAWLLDLPAGERAALIAAVHTHEGTRIRDALANDGSAPSLPPGAPAGANNGGTSPLRADASLPPPPPSETAQAS